MQTNLNHIREYLLFEVLAAIVFLIPAWYFIHSADYNNGWIVYLGSILFMFVIMFHVYKLSRRRPEFKSSWMMMIAGHLPIAAGVIFSVIACLVLCFVYIPGFMSGNSPDSYLKDAPSYTNYNNFATVFQMFFPASW